MQDRHLCCPR